ncbi:MAG: hypothetical protein IJ849_03750 [Selenomonadaceae bacterium]|nr:hypothetical protein [Selenomonadaceae bacterium]
MIDKPITKPAIPILVLTMLSAYFLYNRIETVIECLSLIFLEINKLIRKELSTQKKENQ